MGVNISYHIINSPLGALHLAHSGSGLAAIEFPGDNARQGLENRLRKRYGDDIELMKDRAAMENVLDWFERYFDDPAGTANYKGPYDLGGTEFQKMVWMQMLKIPAGKTMSYKDMALALGRPGAMRAVGSACGANPIPIAIPCHRVVASGGIGGYGGGLPIKRRLLAGEGVEPDQL